MPTKGSTPEKLMQGTLIHSVAEATRHRDRDDLNQAIAALMRDYLQATRVRLYSLIEEHGKLFAMCRVKLGEELTELEAVELSSDPILKECAEQRRKVTALTGERSARTVLPIESEMDVVGLLELH